MYNSLLKKTRKYFAERSCFLNWRIPYVVSYFPEFVPQKETFDMYNCFSNGKFALNIVYQTETVGKNVFFFQLEKFVLKGQCHEKSCSAEALV